MARLPQPAAATETYGARPSLRTNRIDQPADPTIIGDALIRASQTFTQLAGEHKEKTDRLNYSLAKQELLKADLEEREKFKDDDDWETYDSRYRSSMLTRREEISQKYRLSPRDSQLWNAEADYITERSSVSVLAEARTERRIQTRANIDENLIEVREEVLNADPQTANDLMINSIEQLRAAEEQGIYDEQELLAKIQSTVTDIATGRLDAMEVQDRIAELELSLAHRDARGPITIEELEAGGGSGSIADYLHRDVAQKMLDAALEEDRISGIQGEVFRIIDAVMIDIPGTNAQDRAAQLTAARNMLDRNDPEYGAKRNFLEQEIAQRQNQRESIVNQADMEMERGLVDLLDNGATYGSLSPGILSRLPRERREALQRYAVNVQERDGYAESSDSEVLSRWYSLTRQEKMDANLNDIDWKNGMDRQDWERALREQAAYRDAQVANKDPNIYRGDPDDEVLRNLLVGRGKFFDRIPTPGSADYDRYVRIDDEVNRRLMDASLQKWQETGSGYLFPQEVREITAQTVAEVVYIRDGGFMFFDEPVLQAGLSAEERLSGDVYELPIAEIRAIPAGTDSQGRSINMEEYLRNIAGANSDNLDDEDIEQIYFLWKNGMVAEAEARLTGAE